MLANRTYKPEDLNVDEDPRMASVVLWIVDFAHRTAPLHRQQCFSIQHFRTKQSSNAVTNATTAHSKDIKYTACYRWAVGSHFNFHFNGSDVLKCTQIQIFNCINFTPFFWLVLFRSRLILGHFLVIWFSCDFDNSLFGCKEHRWQSYYIINFCLVGWTHAHSTTTNMVKPK